MTDNNAEKAGGAVRQFRVAHDIEFLDEIGRPQHMWRGRMNLPEVFVLSNTTVTLTKEWQEFIFKLNQPWMDGRHFRSLFSWTRAFSNFGAGFDFPFRRRADHINGRDVDAKDPYLDKIRICGGATIQGVLNGRTLTLATLNGNDRPPSVEWLMKNPHLFFRALVVHVDGSTGHFPQCGGKPVLLPLVASKTVKVEVGVKRFGKPLPYLIAI